MGLSFNQSIGKEKELERAPRKLEDFLSPREPIPKSLYLILALSSFAFFLIILVRSHLREICRPPVSSFSRRDFQAGVDSLRN